MAEINGYVPVSKEDLEAITQRYFNEVGVQYQRARQRLIEAIEAFWNERKARRRWFGLFPSNLPDDLTVEQKSQYFQDEYSESPFKSLENIYQRHLQKGSKWQRAAQSKFSGEPILMDIEVFDTFTAPKQRVLFFFAWDCSYYNRKWIDSDD